MKNLKRTVFAAAALVVLVAVASILTQTRVSAVPPPQPTNVVVTNVPLPVSLDDTPFREPFETVATANIASGASEGVGDFGTPVPAGKRFIVEYLSARSYIPAGQKFRLLFFAGGAQYHLSGDFVGTDATQDVYTLSEPVNIYTQIGQPVRVTMTRFVSNAGTATTAMTLSGYLIDG